MIRNFLLAKSIGATCALVVSLVATQPTVVTGGAPQLGVEAVAPVALAPTTTVRTDQRVRVLEGPLPETVPPPVPSTMPPPTTTAAPPPTPTEAPRDSSDGGGVVITSTGVVSPVLSGQPGAWEVASPCDLSTPITEGRYIDHVDIVLDPGHGGSEPGSVGPNGLTEKSLNLQIAEKVQDHLEADGYSVLLTRTTDIRLPLRSRARIAQAVDADVLVSIHHNGGAVSPSDKPGTEVFYQAASDEAKRLGGLIYEELIDNLSDFPVAWVSTNLAGVSARLNDAGADLYGIHRFTPDIPSVISEALYLSNGPEADLLERADVQAAEAQAIAMGILRWYGSRSEGSGFYAPFVDGGSTGTGGLDNCRDPRME